MAYGMGCSWHMSSLPSDLTPNELRQIVELCKPLINFVSSTVCLRWAEAAILINYAGSFMTLVKNVEKAVFILLDQSSHDSIPIWWQYIVARRMFFTDFAYVLRSTRPGYRSWHGELRVMPEGFENRDFAMGLLALGRRYQHYVDEAPIYLHPSGISEAEVETQDTTGQGLREWQHRKSRNV